MSTTASISLHFVALEGGEAIFNLITPEGGGRTLSLKPGEAIKVISSSRAPTLRTDLAE